MANRTKNTSEANNGSRRHGKGTSRRRFLRQALGAGAALALGQFLPKKAFAQASQGSFASPGQLSSGRTGNLNIIMEVNSDFMRSVPNVSSEVQLRYFQGWFPSTPARKVPAVNSSAPWTAAGPGPTLRAQVGDKIQIAFFNRVDDKKFKYTTVTAEGHGQKGCDIGVNPTLYPANDTYPNCFHGSSTANLHFHGTHVSPDGLGDNVLVEVIPDPTINESQMLSWFQTVFRNCPTAWNNMPPEYKTYQRTKVTAMGNGLWEANQHRINAGYWPQYISGGFPNCYQFPRYGTINPYTRKPYTMGQAPGTHWYHAHKHGSTALHIMNGLAGTFIIEDNMPPTSNAPAGYDYFLKSFYGQGTNYSSAFEKVIVFQNISSQQRLELQGGGGRNGSSNVLVNGQLQPVITMLPNEVQLWRLVNATVGSGSVNFGTQPPEGFQWKQTAADGVQFSQKNYNNQPYLSGYLSGFQGGLLLAGGNRADVLVQAPSTPTDGPVPFPPAPASPLFYVNVTNSSPADPSVGKGFPSSAQWPAMPPFLQNLPAPSAVPHPVTFGWEPGRTGPGRMNVLTTNPPLLNIPPHFMIDNHQFRDLVDQCMPLNALQDWELLNTSTVAHPFHIHINPFQVMQVDVPKSDGSGYTTYTPPDDADPVWQDVINIPPGNPPNSNGIVLPGRVRIRQYFVDFIGTFVLHCHILAHEDRGMMQLVRVVDPSNYPAGCQILVPHHD